MNHDTWLQGAAAYERRAGLDRPSEEEERARGLEIERDIDEAIEEEPLKRFREKAAERGKGD